MSDQINNFSVDSFAKANKSCMPGEARPEQFAPLVAQLDRELTDLDVASQLRLHKIRDLALQSVCRRDTHDVGKQGLFALASKLSDYSFAKANKLVRAPRLFRAAGLGLACALAWLALAPAPAPNEDSDIAQLVALLDETDAFAVATEQAGEFSRPARVVSDSDGPDVMDASGAEEAQVVTDLEFYAWLAQTTQTDTPAPSPQSGS
jgi:hypothetical protein